jgi:transposase-like protein
MTMDTDSEQLRNDICRLYDAGHSVTNVARSLGINNNDKVRLILVKSGRAIRRTRERILFQAGIKDIAAFESEVCRLYDEGGRSMTEIAQTFGVNPATIQPILLWFGRTIKPTNSGCAKKIRDADVPEIRRQYDEGRTTKEIGKAFGVSEHTINKTLKQAGQARWSRWEQRLRRAGIKDIATFEAEACRRYAAGERVSEIARIFGVDHSAITDTLRRCGQAIRPSAHAKMLLNQAEVCRRYAAGQGLVEISRAFGVSTGAVGRALRTGGQPTRRSAGPRAWAASAAARRRIRLEDVPEVCRLYEAGHTTREIGKLFGGAAKGTISRVLTKAGLKMRTAARPKAIVDVGTNVGTA